MKKILCIIISSLILLAMPITAYANSSRAITVSPGLYFEDSTVYCSAMINANAYDDVIRAVIRLCYEGERIKVWYTSSEEGILVFEKDVDISEYGNGTYEITVDFTINDESYPRASFEREYQGG